MSHLAPVWYKVTDLDVVSGEGCWVTTGDGDRYLDFTAGIAVTSTGHCHPTVVAAIQAQAARFIHAQANCYTHPLLGELADALDRITPAGIDTFFFSNSGAEATEAAVIAEVDALFADRTRILVSHRAATRVGCELELRLEAGRLEPVASARGD